jgi:hypothetical protein
MKKLILVAGLAILLGGCLGQNRRVKIRRDAADITSGASIHSGSNIWWRTPVYADTPRDENPWEAFIRPNPDRWMDPWGEDPATNYGAQEFPRVKPRAPFPALKPKPSVSEDPALWILPPYLSPDDLEQKYF